jgi:hypothetical protein
VSKREASYDLQLLSQSVVQKIPLATLKQIGRQVENGFMRYE